VSPIMDMGPPQDVSQGRRSTHVLLTDFIGLQGQGTVWLHPCVGKPLLLTCNLGLHTAADTSCDSLVNKQQISLVEGYATDT